MAMPFKPATAPIRRAPLAIGVTCRADIAALTGGAAGSARQLRRLLAARGAVPEEVRLWALGVLAEAAAHAGDVAAAEAAYREGLALGRRDVYLLAAWADFLLDQGRPDVVRRDAARSHLHRSAAASSSLRRADAGRSGVGRRDDTLRRRITAGRVHRVAAHLRGDMRVALMPSARIRRRIAAGAQNNSAGSARAGGRAAGLAGGVRRRLTSVNARRARHSRRAGMEHPTLADLERRSPTPAPEWWFASDAVRRAVPLTLAEFLGVGRRAGERKASDARPAATEAATFGVDRQHLPAAAGSSQQPLRPQIDSPA